MISSSITPANEPPIHAREVRGGRAFRPLVGAPATPPRRPVLVLAAGRRYVALRTEALPAPAHKYICY